MYVQLVDKDSFRSPILYIHADEDEFMGQILEWKKQVRKLRVDHPEVDGLPLGRLEPSVCMVDLIRHLADYYVESTPLSFLPNGHVYGCLRLVSEADEDVVEIKLHEED